MDGENQGRGLLGVLVGLGFAGTLLYPILAYRRLGAKRGLFLSALSMTVFAITQPYIEGWSHSEANVCQGVGCQAEALHGLVTLLPTLGWWAVAIAGWGLLCGQIWWESQVDDGSERS